ncbi:MAG: hypothetical protein O3B73_14760 [bacterium]|nr:hypothetical protein [bacterium]
MISSEMRELGQIRDLQDQMLEAARRINEIVKGMQEIREVVTKP